MIVHEAAVIGGNGGSPYSHAAELEAAGYCLGAGPNCMRLSALHVEKWQVLSHHSATYTSIRDPAHTFTTAGRANIKTDNSTEFHIPADHRVRRVCASASELEWAAGGRCLNLLQIKTVPVAATGAEGSQAQVTTFGSCSFGAEVFQQPGTKTWQSIGGATCKVLIVPEGLTLVGIAGWAGDSWDQVSLLVGPWLPMGGWSPGMHKHLITPLKQQAATLLLCLQELQASATIHPLNKQVTECLVAALFDATFMPPAAAAAAGSSAQDAAAAHNGHAAAVEQAGSSAQDAAAHLSGHTAAAAAGSSVRHAAAAHVAHATEQAGSSTQEAAAHQSGHAEQAGRDTQHAAAASAHAAEQAGSSKQCAAGAHPGAHAAAAAGSSTQAAAAAASAHDAEEAGSSKQCAGTEGHGTAAAAADDYVAAWVRQQVQQARAECDHVVLLNPHHMAVGMYGYDSDDSQDDSLDEEWV